MDQTCSKAVSGGLLDVLGEIGLTNKFDHKAAGAAKEESVPAPAAEAACIFCQIESDRKDSHGVTGTGSRAKGRGSFCYGGRNSLGYACSTCSGPSHTIHDYIFVLQERVVSNWYFQATMEALPPGPAACAA